MKLYSSLLSPNALRTRLVVSELGLAPEVIEVDLGSGEHRSPEYLGLNPNGKVPTLIDGDLVIWESRAINAYLASVKPEPGLYPADPRRRARIDQWSYWQAIHFGPSLQRVAFERVLKPFFGMGVTDEGVVEAEWKTIAQLLPILDSALAGREYVGDALSIADIALAGSLVLRVPSAIGIESYPNLDAWLQRIEARPTWQRVITPYYDALRARGLQIP